MSSVKESQHTASASWKTLLQVSNLFVLPVGCELETKLTKFRPTVSTIQFHCQLGLDIPGNFGRSIKLKLSQFSNLMLDSGPVGLNCPKPILPHFYAEKKAEVHSSLQIYYQ